MTTNVSKEFANCLQKLFPGEILTLIDIDATKFGGQVYRFHNENIAYSTEELLAAVNGGTLTPKAITFRGEQYGPRPFGIGGIAMSSDGTVEKPTLTVSNIDAQASALIRSYNGLMQARSIGRRDNSPIQTPARAGTSLFLSRVFTLCLLLM